MKKQEALERIRKIQAVIEALPDSVAILDASTERLWTDPNKYTMGPSIHLLNGIDISAEALGIHAVETYKSDSGSIWRYATTDNNVEIFQIFATAKEAEGQRES